MYLPHLWTLFLLLTELSLYISSTCFKSLPRKWWNIWTHVHTHTYLRHSALCSGPVNETYFVSLFSRDVNNWIWWRVICQCDYTTKAGRFKYSCSMIEGKGISKVYNFSVHCIYNQFYWLKIMLEMHFLEFSETVF